MAKLITWIFVIALLIMFFGKGNMNDGQQLALLVLLSVLTISEAIEKIGRKMNPEHKSEVFKQHEHETKEG